MRKGNGTENIGNDSVSGKATIPERSSVFLFTQKILQKAIETGLVDLQQLEQQVKELDRKEILNKHTQKIWQNKKGRLCTYIYQDGKRKRLEIASDEEFYNRLYEHYKDAEKTLYDVCIEWLDQRKEFHEFSTQTYTRYKSDAVRFFKNADCYVLKKNMKNIVDEDIEVLIKTLIRDEKLTRKTFKMLATLINGTFKYAKKKGYTNLSITEIRGDMVIPASAFTKKVEDDETAIFYENELRRVIAYCEEDRTVWNDVTLLMLRTGLRVGEATALKVCDVDGDKLKIRRTEIKATDEAGHSQVTVQDMPKSAAGVRDVYLSEEARKMLDGYTQGRKQGDYLFVNGDGKRIRGTTITKHLYTICDNLKIPRRSSHKARRTYATILLDSGVVDDANAARQLGHKSVETTRKAYYFRQKTKTTEAEQIKAAVSF